MPSTLRPVLEIVKIAILTGAGASMEGELVTFRYIHKL